MLNNTRYTFVHLEECETVNSNLKSVFVDDDKSISAHMNMSWIFYSICFAQEFLDVFSVFGNPVNLQQIQTVNKNLAISVQY